MEEKKPPDISIKSVWIGFWVFVVAGFLIILLFYGEGRISYLSQLWSFFDLAPALAYGIGAGIILASLVVFLYTRSYVTLPDNEYTRLIIGMVFKKYGIVTIAFGAGVSEELLFRGALQGVLTVYIGSVPALLLIAGVFMILHIPQYKGSAFIHTLVFVMGLILGGLFIWSGSLWAPIAAHVTYNGCLAYILKKKRPQHKLPSYAAVCMRLSS